MNRRSKAFLQFGLFLGSLILINVLGNVFYGYLDLTEEKRYTLTEPTVNLLNDLDEVVYVRVLLGGSYPAEFKRLPKAVRETLEDFKSETGLLEYEFEDPMTGNIEDVNAIKKQFNERGMIAMNLGVRDVNEQSDQIVYPYAIFSYKGREVDVPLFENDPAVPPDIQMNNSVALLEYKFANAIQKLQISTKPAILFTAGNGELGPLYTTDLRETLAPFYNTGPLFLDSVTQINPEVACLIVAKPRFAFSDRDLFKLDQYVMSGGKVIWLIDQLGVSLDSLRGRRDFIPLPMGQGSGGENLNLDELLFNYGVRIQPNLILDIQSESIALAPDQTGQLRKFPWYYYPVLIPDAQHPVVKSLDGIISFFPSTIDTVRTKTKVDKTILLHSSEKSRYQIPPGARLSFEILRYPADPDKFNKGEQPVAVLLEGSFSSL
ncbi:MAG: Gldg family protein, partial [Bacteroidota bacterium]